MKTIEDFMTFIAGCIVTTVIAAVMAAYIGYKFNRAVENFNNDVTTLINNYEKIIKDNIDDETLIDGVYETDAWQEIEDIKSKY